MKYESTGWEKNPKTNLKLDTKEYNGLPLAECL